MQLVYLIIFNEYSQIFQFLFLIKIDRSNLHKWQLFEAFSNF